jgi:feruloyl esterase
LRRVRLAIGVIPGGDSAQGAFSDGPFALVTARPELTPRTWDTNNWLASLSLVGALYQAFNPDLSGLKARGAKLIL